MNYEINLKGLAVLYYPVVWLWKLLYSTITPRFINGILGIAQNDIPLVLKIIILVIVSIFILMVYISVWGILMGFIVSLAIIISVVYSLAAIVNVIGGWWEFWFVNIKQGITAKFLLNI